MLRKPRTSLLTVAGLRMKFYPRVRVGQGLLSVAPWVNVLLLMGFFLVLNSRLVLQPGVTVHLPPADFRDGSAADLVAVVLSVPAAQGRGREEIVFFDDERFLAASAEQMRLLKRAVDAKRREHPAASLVIQADARVAHGTVMGLLAMATDVGVRRVNLATRPTEGGGRGPVVR